jgi:uncharacterized membrane protein YphA (DoxX/SURF4 family)
MNTATRVFLVLLRLAIGWHLLFAGLAKFSADYRGSEGYLMEASGPLAGLFHRLAGDRIVAQLTVEPLDPKQDPSQVPLSARCPAALAAEWEGYLDCFTRHYGLTPQQQEQARVKLEQYKHRTTGWILNESKVVRKPSQYGPPLDVRQTTQERLAEYVAQRDALRSYQAGEFNAGMRTPFASDRNRDLLAQKAAVARLRSDLAADLDLKSSEMKDSLREVLTPEQEERGPLPQPVRVGWKYMTRMDWIDFLVRWGLTLTGGCLLLGLFSRTASAVAALLLLSFFLAMPPLPGLPEAVRAEGYPFVNKNLVEIFALLTLATTASGRWAGLDAILYWLNPWRKKAAAELSTAHRPSLARRAPPPGDANQEPEEVPLAAPVSANEE